VVKFTGTGYEVYDVREAENNLFGLLVYWSKLVISSQEKPNKTIILL